MRSAAPKAATTPSIRSSARSTTSARLVAACGGARPGDRARLRRSSARPTIPGSTSIPNWFRRRPDGSIRYAENPPKKYEDIVNPDFYCDDARPLWNALRDVVLFWVEQGVRIFRVDNPHTKPLPFWEWMIREVQPRHPDVIFLSEAFTRPKMMKGLAKLGFTQSYTYFTWRTQKGEIEQYLTRADRLSGARLSSGRTSSSTRPTSCRSICRAASRGCSSRASRWPRRCRATTASTTASSCCEHEPIPGREEYLNSEKYEIKVRDWDTARQHQGLHRAAQPHPARQSGAAADRQSRASRQVDDDEVIGFVKESVDARQRGRGRDRADRASPASSGCRFGDIEIGRGRRPTPVRRGREPDHRRAARRSNGAACGCGIDPARDPALLFRCLA